mgnify:FL=1|tara:strand:- start:589 stop:1731 length:1143 start_codon:yes stop_codon:yes gene_type:complete
MNKNFKIKKNIKIYDLKFDKSYRRKFHVGVDKILDEGFLSNHTFVKKFESKFAKVNKSKFSIAVNSGTSAIELILRSLNIKNKYILIGNNTFIATAVAAKNAGGKPYPVDIDNKYFGLSYKDLKKKINKNIGAVIIIHINGLITPDIYKIVNLCKKYNVPLVEDCAQAFASSMNGKHVGNFGIAGAFSLQTTKVLTAGEGGVVVTDQYKFYKQMLKDRLFGVSEKHNLIHTTEGNNLKMSEFVALAGICDLDRIKIRIRKRKLLASRYQNRLKDTCFKTLKPVKNSSTAYYKQIIISPFKRDLIIANFKKNKISMTGGVYYFPLHRQKVLGIKKDNLFPNSSYFSDYHFCPPCYPELNIKDVDYICDILIELSKKLIIQR